MWLMLTRGFIPAKPVAAVPRAPGPPPGSPPWGRVFTPAGYRPIEAEGTVTDGCGAERPLEVR
jgi:cytochrome oxidase assembly protein ShyY1